MSEDKKEWKIGNYKLLIDNKKFWKTELHHPYYASLYKDRKTVD